MRWWYLPVGCVTTAKYELAVVLALMMVFAHSYLMHPDVNANATSEQWKYLPAGPRSRTLTTSCIRVPGLWVASTGFEFVDSIHLTFDSESG